MSLYNDASLAMIPSAYKDGKLYSIRPTDGSGDFTFSRGSNLAATRVDENGLIEKGRENLLLQSNQFDTTWVNVNTTEIGGQVGYDGSSAAWLLSKSAAGGRIYQNITGSGIVTSSIYLKANASNWGLLQLDGTPDAYIYVDLINGVSGSTGSGNIDATITSVGGGWYRVSVTTNSTTRIRIYPAEANGDVSGTSGSIYIQDAQLEAGLVATDYIETTTTTAQAGILEDMPRLDYSGGASCPSLLLEPTRTNLFPQSEYPSTSTLNLVNGGYTWTYNQINSPDGLQNAAKWSAANNSAVVGVYQNFSATSGTSYTFSLFAKKGNHNFIQLQNGGGGSGANSYANFDLENGTKSDGATITDSFIEDYGNGWYRCGITFSVSATVTSNCSIDIIDDLSAGRNSTFTGSIGDYFYAYGLQLESGSYPTSYIPCYGAATTRSLDNGDVLDTNTFGTDGEDVTYFFEFVNNTLISRDSASTSIKVNNSTSNLGSFRIYRSSSSDYRLAVVFQDNDNNFSPSGTATSTDNAKVLIKREWATGLIEVFVNGVKQISATSLLFNEWSKIEIEGGGSTINIKQAAVFPSVLTDSECIALTS